MSRVPLETPCARPVVDIATNTAAGVIGVLDQPLSATRRRGLRPGTHQSLGTQPHPRASDDGAVRL
jgi:hypothetical protein